MALEIFEKIYVQITLAYWFLMQSSDKDVWKNNYWSIQSQ